MNFFLLQNSPHSPLFVSSGLHLVRREPLAVNLPFPSVSLCNCTSCNCLFSLPQKAKASWICYLSCLLTSMDFAGSSSSCCCSTLKRCIRIALWSNSVVVLRWQYGVITFFFLHSSRVCHLKCVPLWQAAWASICQGWPVGVLFLILASTLSFLLLPAPTFLPQTPYFSFLSFF